MVSWMIVSPAQKWRSSIEIMFRQKIRRMRRRHLYCSISSFLSVVLGAFQHSKIYRRTLRKLLLQILNLVWVLIAVNVYTDTKMQSFNNTQYPSPQDHMHAPCRRVSPSKEVRLCTFQDKANHSLSIDQGPVSISRIPIIKISSSHDRLIFKMKIPYLKRQSLYWDGPWCLTISWIMQHSTAPDTITNAEFYFGA